VRRSLFITVILALLFSSATSLAADKNMIFCLTGFPGTTAQAQQAIDNFLRHVENVLGWPANSASGAFYPDPVQGSSHLKNDSPSLAVVTPDLYLSLHKELKMKIIAKVKAAGRGEEQYSIVVSKAKIKSLAELKGKKVAGAVLYNPTFVTNILFGGEIKASDVTLVNEPRPLSGLRSVNKGEVDAAVVDRSVLAHMASLPFAADLAVIHTSTTLPLPVVVALPGGAKYIGAFKAKMSDLCGAPEGKTVCEAAQLESIEPANESDYKSLTCLYEGKPCGKR